MPRNASGTYTLPSGNPVVSGNIIEASWANSTLSDVATELTNSLSRTGAGGMTGALRLADGSASVPGLAWVSETGTGFYRANLNDIRFVVATNLVQQWTASGSSITGTLTASGQVRGGGTSGAQFIGNDVLYANSRVFFATQGDGTQRINVGHYDSSALSFPTGLVSAQILAGVSDLHISTRDIAGASVVFRTGAGVLEQMRLDSSGNLGLGVTPSAWGSNQKAIQLIANSRSHLVTFANAISVGANYYADNSSYYYTTTGQSATRFDQNNGVFSWHLAPSGTAGNAISFTQAMTLDASGNLGIGTTSPTARLHVGASGGTIQLRLGNNTGLDYWGIGRDNVTTGDLVFQGQTTEYMRLTASGNLLVGTTSTGADGLGVSNLLNLTFPEGSGTSYANLFRQTSSAATIIANGYKRSATASGFASSVGTSWAKTAIGLGVSTGDITFYTDAAGTVANGTDVTPTERARITSAGSFVAGGSVALATTATDGFLYVPTCAGTPTGTPTAITGMAPIVVNTTNNKLYFYSGGAWRDAGP